MRSYDDTTEKSGKLLDCPSDVRRQEMQPYYCINGSIYIINTAHFDSSCRHINDSDIGMITPLATSVDIDSPQDFGEALGYLLGRQP